jgi:hypothetical protein
LKTNYQQVTDTVTRITENMASVSSQSKAESLDWPFVLNIAIPLVGGQVFTKKDIDALRQTCKLTHSLATPLISKFRINTEFVPADDYATITASPILDHIHQLAILTEPDEAPNPIWPEHTHSLVSILKRCAPHLERLDIQTRSQDYSETPHFLNEKCQFSKLKSLLLYPADLGIIKSVEPSLNTMSSLERLMVGRGEYCQIDIEGLKVIAKAPFLTTLTELELALGGDFDFEQEEPTELITAHVASILQETINLKIFNLIHARSLEAFNSAPALGNLETLKLEFCLISETVTLPPSLLYLNLYGCIFSSLDATINVFGSGALCQLKTLKLDGCRCPLLADGVYIENWDFVHLLNLARVKSITFKNCGGLSQNTALRIAEAAPKIQNLIKFELQGEKFNVDFSLLKKFCTSSLATTLEYLNLSHGNLGDDGVNEIVEDASDMKCLKYLGLAINGEEHVEMIAQAGALGGWPQLQKLALYSEAPRTDKELWSTYCKQILDPVWPGLDSACIA